MQEKLTVDLGFFPALKEVINDESLFALRERNAERLKIARAQFGAQVYRAAPDIFGLPLCFAPYLSLEKQQNAIKNPFMAELILTAVIMPDDAPYPREHE